MDDFELYARVKKNVVVDYFNKFIRPRKCSVCSTGELLILGDDNGLLISRLDVQAYDDDNTIQKGNFGSYIVSCTNCGNQNFLNVKTLSDAIDALPKGDTNEQG